MVAFLWQHKSIPERYEFWIGITSTWNWVDARTRLLAADKDCSQPIKGNIASCHIPVECQCHWNHQSIHSTLGLVNQQGHHYWCHGISYHSGGDKITLQLKSARLAPCHILIQVTFSALLGKWLTLCVEETTWGNWLGLFEWCCASW